MGLIFPQLGCWEGISLATPVEIILPDLERREVEEMIEKMLGGQEDSEKGEEVDNCVKATIIDVEDDVKLESKIVTISPNVMDEKDKESANCEDSDATNNDAWVWDDNLEIKTENDSTESPNFRKKWVCHVCDMTFRFIEELRKHALESHQSLNFLKCKYCDFETNTNQHLKRHENIHTKEKQFPCDECSKLFLELGDMKKHKSSHSDTLSVKCDLCDKTLKSTFYLSRHKKLMHNKLEGENEDKKFLCELCSSELRTKDYLRRHMKKVHSGYLFMCSHCDKKFKTKGHSKEHEEIHTGDIKYTECTVCGFTTRDLKRDIERHMKTHYNTNSLKCDKCDYHFRSQMYLIDHDRIAHQE